MPDRLRSVLPNAITLLRLAVAAAFFATLSIGLGSPGSTKACGNTALWLFVFAAVTDFLDGYLARRWKVVSAFGRVMDPFVDKVLILGAFIYLASPPFEMSDRPGAPPGSMVTGIGTWMVVVILARELLVTSIRGVLESEGIAFGADIWGKVKMVVQCVTIPVCLLTAINDLGPPGSAWAIIRTSLVWLTIASTVGSALPYLIRGRRLLAKLAQGQRA